jgi:glycosyltransferase involved in cell wall biosynthesis
VKTPKAKSVKPVVLDTRVVCGAGGGPDKTILNSPRFLSKAGYRMLCAYMHPPGDAGFEQLRRKAAAWQAPLLAVPDRGPWDWKVVAQLLAICRREKVSIWHGHDYKSNLLGLVVRRFWPMRLVTTVHGWVHQTRRTPLYYRIDRFCLPRYEKVLAVSQDLYDQCRDAGVPADQCLLIENGVDCSEFCRCQTTEQAKRSQGLVPGRFVLGAVGRLSAEKGFDLLIRASDQLLKNGFDLELLIIGEGDERQRLEAMIASLGRADRIRLLGYRADVRGLYEAMDIFALSSLREGLPNVVLEAMAMEVPVVATRVAGVPHLIADGDNGLLAEPCDLAGLTRALAHLLSDAGLRRRLSRAGRTTIETRYSFAGRMDRVRTVYEELLGRNQTNNAGPIAISAN